VLHPEGWRGARPWRGGRRPSGSRGSDGSAVGPGRLDRGRIRRDRSSWLPLGWPAPRWHRSAPAYARRFTSGRTGSRGAGTRDVTGGPAHEGRGPVVAERANEPDSPRKTPSAQRLGDQASQGGPSDGRPSCRSQGFHGPAGRTGWSRRCVEAGHGGAMADTRGGRGARLPPMTGSRYPPTSPHLGRGPGQTRARRAGVTVRNGASGFPVGRRAGAYGHARPGGTLALRRLGAATGLGGPLCRRCPEQKKTR